MSVLVSPFIPLGRVLTGSGDRLWEGLNFTKAGLIPRAGRLKKPDGSGEEFIDAWVFYKRFDPLPEVSA